jgi:hypothetical protein
MTTPTQPTSEPFVVQPALLSTLKQSVALLFLISWLLLVAGIGCILSLPTAPYSPQPSRVKRYLVRLMKASEVWVCNFLLTWCDGRPINTSK